MIGNVLVSVLNRLEENNKVYSNLKTLNETQALNFGETQSQLDDHIHQLRQKETLIVRLENERDDLQERCDTVEKENDEIVQLHDEQKDTFENFKMSIESEQSKLQLENRKLKDNYEKERALRREWEEKVKEIGQDNEDLRKSHDEVKSKLNDLTKKHDHAIQKVEECDRLKERYRQKTDQIEEKNRELTLTLAKANVENEKLGGIRAGTGSGIRTSYESRQSVGWDPRGDEVVRLKSELEETRAALYRQEAENRTLKQIRGSCSITPTNRRRLSSVSAHPIRIRSSSESMRLGPQLDAYVSPGGEKATGENDVLEQELYVQQSKLKDAVDENKKLGRELVNRQSEIEFLNIEIQQLRSPSPVYAHQRRNFTGAFEDSPGKKAELLGQVDQLTSELRKLKQEHHRTLADLGQMNVKENRTSEVNESVNNSFQALSQLTVEALRIILGFGDKFNALNRVVEIDKRTVQTVESKLRNTPDTQIFDWTGLEEALLRLSDWLRFLMDEWEHSLRSVGDLKTDVQIYTKQVTQMKMDHDELKREHSKLKDSEHALNQELTRLRDQQEIWTKEKSMLREREEDTNKENHQLRFEHATLKKDRHYLESNLKTLQTSHSTLERQTEETLTSSTQIRNLSHKLALLSQQKDDLISLFRRIFRHLHNPKISEIFQKVLENRQTQGDLQVKKSLLAAELNDTDIELREKSRFSINVDDPMLISLKTFIDKLKSQVEELDREIEFCRNHEGELEDRLISCQRGEVTSRYRVEAERDSDGDVSHSRVYSREFTSGVTLSSSGYHDGPARSTKLQDRLKSFRSYK